MTQAIVMHSMELDDEELADMAWPIPMGGKDTRPRFPCGLVIALSDVELRKLKVDFPDGECIGGMIHGHFMGRITSASQSDNQSGTSCRLEIQIEDLAVESEDEENTEAETKKD